MIEHGSIEVFTPGPEGENHGFPITTLFPFDMTKAAPQVKARTGVTLGPQLDRNVKDNGDGTHSIPDGLEGRWAGTSPVLGDVEVRVWKTA